MRSPFSAIHVHHLEGAVKRVPSDATAYAHRDARWLLNIVGSWRGQEGSDEQVAWVRELWQAVQPSATGALYLNFLGEDGPDRVRAAFGADKAARLARLKKAYDPDNFFRINQNIRPAR